jgi:cyclopropane-fatty-acyl-phospholipid synthase
MSLANTLLERNLLPDAVVRMGVRRLLRARLRQERLPSEELQQERFAEIVAAMDAAPIAIDTRAANQQHYEVPTEFFHRVLGNHLKYSSGYWRPGVTDLDQSEAEMLDLTCRRALLQDGQRVLDLGCGWGAFTLFAAQRYPASHFTAVSNSATQRLYIEKTAHERGLRNVRVLTADMNAFGLNEKFDRMVSVEMIEHMRNHRRLFAKLAEMLAPGGRLFIHIFTHRVHPYFFEIDGDSDWMARYFFTGGMMPSADLPFVFQDHLKVERHWRVDGTHYRQTLEAWLRKMDAQRSALWPLFERTYGVSQALKWWVYWRVFFMASAELFGFDEGREWFVSHYRFRKG